MDSGFVDPNSPEGKLQLLIRQHANLAHSLIRKNERLRYA